MKPFEEIDQFNVLITGVGGQGNILASMIMADAAVGTGLKVRVGETFGAAQRGGTVASHVRMGMKVYSPIIFPHEANVVIGLEPIETLRATIKYGNPDSLIIFSKRPVLPVIVRTGGAKYPELIDIIQALKQLSRNVICLDAYDLAAKAGNPLAMNVVMLGAFASTQKGLIPIRAYKVAIKENIREKMIKTNLKAFDLGMHAITAS